MKKNIYITGENGFIARNLILQLEKNANYEVINNKTNNLLNYKRGEIDFVNNDYDKLKQFLIDNNTDIIVHSGAIVGTDVCALYPKETILNNVFGTYNISHIAKELNIPVVYLGTTVIYDTSLEEVQNGYITENSIINPITLYGITKYEGEIIVKNLLDNYVILRPLFCYGGVRDMNSLMAKTIYADIVNRKDTFKIFLDKQYYKDYMHVNDFVNAIILAIDCELWTKNTDYNISLMEPKNTREIYETILDVTNITKDRVEWMPKTDYLKNHRIDNKKFREDTNWQPKISLIEGIKIQYESIRKNINEDYNPLKHLDDINRKNINIEKYYE